ncbi:2-hydroxychromene-2-carboxylate isomerase [Salinihabitans flavidus]|uniref:2-hydroxychromene-2-carboxylate isomerase n=1 Tax=Salinihabitans flavidus TaxID=569882 RepID=A0A1H8V4H9_9RHOB|nr:2-hydroxychromene-2-carboxylate isomerase [Salinihabitans flavidus]SEP10123.1 2-hydroxychromene-2-carboxylate isomerase [Salinihabitans flavidus]
MPAIEVWFSVGSTYSYLTISRLPAIERQTGIAFDWRPFSVREIMREMDNIPFATKPAKAAYMWRDIARRAERLGLHAHLPAPYPLEGFDLANRVAIVAADEGWCADYAQATYRTWFEKGHPAGAEPNLTASLTAAGQNPARVLKKAESAETEEAYRAATDEARARGIFGAPTFAVGEELFWGDDRLEDALDWHRHGALRKG